MKIFNKTTWLLVTLALAISPVWGQYSLYWDLPAGPSGLCLGLGHLIINAEPEGALVHPASLGSVKWRSAKASGLQWWQDVYAGSFSAALPWGRVGAGGLSLGYWSFGSMARLGPNGENRGNFESQAVIWDASLGSSLFYGLSFGLSVKGYSLLMLDRKDWSWGADFSAKYEYRFLTAHILARNLGPKYPVNNAIRFSLPSSANVGLGAKLLRERISAGLLYSSVKGQHPYLSWGMELRPVSFLALRCGYDTDDSKPERSPLGLGLCLSTTGSQDYSVEYGYRSYGALGNVHAISLGISF